MAILRNLSLLFCLSIVLPFSNGVEYVEGENYFKMLAFQRYAVQEADINDEGHCSHQCDRYTGDRKAVHTSCTNSHSICHSARKCAGNLYSCVDQFASYSELWICPSESDSTRRYEYMLHGYYSRLWGKYTTKYGDYDGKCNRSLSYDYRAYGSGWKICETCLCTCQDSNSPTSDQKINIRPITADKDHVITSVRWMKKDHTLTLQIQQGEIRPDGVVDTNSIHWKDVQEPRGDSDIMTLSWLSLRGFLLQDMEVPKGNVLVGVKLATVDSSKMFVTDYDTMKLIAPQLLSVPYDVKTGKLTYATPFYEDPSKADDQSIWDPLPKVSLSYSDFADLGDGRIPTKAPQPLNPVNARSVLLTTTHFLSDLGQNTIPFFDMEVNVIDPPSALSGLGIYLKNRDNYGGFLGLKLIKFDQSS